MSCDRGCVWTNVNNNLGLSPVNEEQTRIDPVTSETLSALAATIRARKGASPETSYTAKLLQKGAAHCARKFGEEAIETVIAALEPDDRALAEESADVLYHLLVLLEARGVKFADVLAILEARTSQSGLEEKASRNAGN